MRSHEEGVWVEPKKCNNWVRGVPVLAPKRPRPTIGPIFEPNTSQIRQFMRFLLYKSLVVTENGVFYSSGEVGEHRSNLIPPELLRQRFIPLSLIDLAVDSFFLIPKGIFKGTGFLEALN